MTGGDVHRSGSYSAGENSIISNIIMEIKPIYNEIIIGKKDQISL